MPAIYLTDADVAALVDMPAAVAAMTDMFRQLAAGHAENIPRRRCRSGGAMLHSMSAAAGYLGRLGWKQYLTTHTGAQFLIGLYDAELGQLLALIDGERLGTLRTGATTGVAIGCMAATDACEIGIFGTGLQARGQLAAAAVARKLKRVFVYGRDAERRAAFAHEMSAELGCDVVPVDRPSEAVEDLPIVITATTSREPVFQGGWLAEGCLVCAVGSNALKRAEIDAATIRRADHIVCDSVEACRLEAGDFVDALARGDFDWSRAVELADVVAGRDIGRSHAGGAGLFKSVGLAIEDVALASLVYDRAREQQRGTPLPF
ncbi:MAG: ornithine cyclodeaminase family protein [Planctomycetes bacterium]|nr:ornithine cyclodeaminase family protein [Planctomycetota bacterium]